MIFLKKYTVCSSKTTYIHKYHLNEFVVSVPKNKEIPRSEETKREIRISNSIKNKKRYSYIKELKKISLSTKQLMYKPEIRKKHLNGLHHSKKIINILKPNGFWIFNYKSKTYKNILGD